MTATFKSYPANPTEALTVSTPTITVTGTGPYVIHVPLTRAQSGTTLGVGEWFIELARTDSGSNKTLARGVLVLHQTVRDLPS